VNPLPHRVEESIGASSTVFHLGMSSVAEVARLGPYHSEQLPGTLDAPQPLRAAVVQDDVGAHDQVPHGPGGEDLPGPGRGHHPRRDVHRDAADIAIA
jgi:hypothetical protein